MAAAVPICVIGGGSIGLRHAEQAIECDAVSLSAVVEPGAARREELQAMGLPAVATLDDVPDGTRAAVVATPTPDHVVSGLAVIERSWAALVEKPITQTIEEGTLLCEAAETRGVPLVTGHHRRCHPFVSEARAMQDRIGDLVGVNGLWSLRKHDTYYDVPWRRQKGAGPILTNLSHEIDLLRFFAGEVVEVSAMTANARRGLEIEDTAAIAFRFANGALGTFLISDAGASPWAFEAASGENPAIAFSGEDAMRIVGTKGAFGFPSLDLWQGGAGKDTDWRNPMQVTKGPNLPVVDPIREQLARFARVADGGEEPLLATGRDGLATLAVTEAVLKSAESGRVESI
ncbi:Gfo/Idh/MocA family protein [Actibacterium pelagium]|uniref:Oxidoreductase n=1 Tax=Actibacterium pelagium TaxID=2029103 RepID=A0A917AMF9_9RHOB|nr:Gfo/Idh/MocA family oxidoreductase [Actibacterium pelagium]GGE58463.1 oxidoreductase [Actibacterium pelagium]